MYHTYVTLRSLTGFENNNEFCIFTLSSKES